MVAQKEEVAYAANHKNRGEMWGERMRQCRVCGGNSRETNMMNKEGKTEMPESEVWRRKRQKTKKLLERSAQNTRVKDNQYETESSCRILTSPECMHTLKLEFSYWSLESAWFWRWCSTPR